MFSININDNEIIIVTDDKTVEFCLVRTIEYEGFIPWKGRIGIIKKKVAVYSSKVRKTINGIKAIIYKIGIGWIGYLVNVFSNLINADDAKKMKEYVMSSDYPTIPFQNLRDYQNSDVLFLLKFRIGLLQCNTSYGKTEVISTLANYYRSQNKKVMLITPGNKARDELIKRCNIRFGLNVSTTLGDDLCCLITSGVTNKKEYKTPEGVNNAMSLLNTYEVVLADEVEYTLSDGGKFLYSGLSKANHVYGFSGTADKYLGNMINFNQGLSDVVLRNKDVIDIFGPALVYRMPLNKVINDISIRVHALDNVKTSVTSNNIYNDVMRSIWMDENVCKAIIKVIRKFPCLFIPLNDLQSIINFWIDKFKGIFRILLVCGKGYIYYDLDKSERKISLDECCNLIKSGLVDVIPSTSAGYRALDFPDLKNILLIQGIIGGVVLQAIGRCARGNTFNIITLVPYFSSRKIPVYSKGLEHRKEMINNYYKYCSIIETIINEEQL